MIQFYCHYNTSTSEICKISPQQEKDTDDLAIIVFPIAEAIALSMLSGETNSNQWIAINSVLPGSDCWILTEKILGPTNKISRADGSLICILQEGVLTELTDVHLVINNVDKFIDVYFRIASLNTAEKMIEFYFTKKNDSSFLLNSLHIDIESMRDDASRVTDPSILHVRQRFSYKKKIVNNSVLTTRIFTVMTMETINDSL